MPSGKDPSHADIAHAAAAAAHLRYVTDLMPGIRRKRKGKTFLYMTVKGRVIRQPAELKRIKALVIPPAWTDVWICPFPNGHIQAVGQDARGRKQYRYHAHWRAVRDRTKFHKMIAFAEALPRIRKQVLHDLSLQGLPREKVLAAIVRLLETTLIRIGNEEYAHENHSYGLTTFLNRHVRVHGSMLEFHFHGKSGVTHTIAVQDKRLAKIIHGCQEIPGQHLFEYIDEQGDCHVIESADVNAYIRQIAGHEFSAKDFRTWHGTVQAAIILSGTGPAHTETHLKKNLTEAVRRTAQKMGNTVAVCRKYYIHPAVYEAYRRKLLPPSLGHHQAAPTDAPGLRVEERKVVEMLERAEKGGWME